LAHDLRRAIYTYMQRLTDPMSICAILLMPLFTKSSVNAVWCGHEHVYERLNPQQASTSFSNVNRVECYPRA